MDLTLRAGVPRAVVAESQVIVVGADDDVFGPSTSGRARQNADHVLVRWRISSKLTLRLRGRLAGIATPAFPPVNFSFSGLREIPWASSHFSMTPRFT
jgi:hypothetical protein